MNNRIAGGQVSYGHIVGILMNDSTSPRIPGDPGHAETFSFPVIYEVLKDFPFEDLIAIKKDNVDLLINQALALEEKGVSLVVTDCGLFGPFHEELRARLSVPFIGSALDLVPLLHHFLPFKHQVGIITGDTRLLQQEHLEASNILPDTVVLAGMEKSLEFQRVVIERAQDLDVEMMRQGVVDAALTMKDSNIGCVVLECTNLISFRSDIQKALGQPVFDLVTLVELFVSGLQFRDFNSRFMHTI